ncbi:hypothetical protein A3C91_04070 [Candidatus Azambacteria bacterium RIFCSPHIGHO2_02_FULL_52_12]|uniref:ZIP family metal transporter n=1 Tax=Candidatus Azambacteria bacterium RIFCSPLOWO2_01_FULL_46_25 TaxID=1797298 RepID=A0A1F5BV16_9BACT|nr:MAG: hypothetical protein A3C91_04070 [Candidatus Azambacteria bacterium RIFCSPHIGHO2_02_FULL_52_12]OGD34422.1 MAG: hypothetical protein A2988_02755 [Candidatus Azambacteria bacterium RIFCSPLOWO2_01_FULL_46_25]OGD37300.1 MAG: hypothetical protein A2850_01135 [Candidatus Azambacteria bacterium RIFCSPHIGHO2_01_FULL_51_74]
MLAIWFYTLFSVAVVSAISLVGAVTLYFRVDFLRKILLFLVSFSAGALLGDVFLHLLPEAMEGAPSVLGVSVLVLAGITLFFVLEKFIHWFHRHEYTHWFLPPHEDEKKVHPMALTNLIGDGLHNFIDGMVIAGSFLISVPVGIATTLAVAFHEIPQEIGNFGVLIHSGLSVGRALWLNFLSALTAVVGAIVVLLAGAQSDAFLAFIIALTIGGFIYIAGSDLIPELHKEQSTKNAVYQVALFGLGIGMMALLLFLE